MTRRLTLDVRVTEEEKEQVRKLAAALHLTVSSYVRMKVLEDIPKGGKGRTA